MGDWLPEPDSLASQLVVGVWLGSAIAFTIGYRVTESGITAPLAAGSGDEAVRRALLDRWCVNHRFQQGLDPLTVWPSITGL